MKKLNKIAYEVADIQAPMKVIINYLECIHFQAKQSKNSEDVALIFHTLVNNRGLDNVIGTLEMLSDRAEELSNLILDYSDAEGIADEQA
ncbi:hypothetical protein [Enterococcus hirae]|uniref:hypothetical protein n=1 Tax=Enterococcus hirae TaxID=1354 RepID=UPI001A9579A5|nr:hypothetical protein [Enterococcus hirae]MBO1102353.1 hypothetical protein [Enterococcus hirae]